MTTRCGKLLLIEINFCYSEPYSTYRMKWQDFKNLIKFPAFAELTMKMRDQKTAFCGAPYFETQN
jgi:hypothetical protein